MGCDRGTYDLIFWTLFTLASRVAFYILSPLTLDAISQEQTNTSNNPPPNTTNHNVMTVAHIQETSIVFICIFEWLITLILSGILLVGIYIFMPNKIGENERNFPTRNYVYNGIAMGMCTYLWNTSSSGKRTPPYLMGILGNCMVPLQFIIRFILLRKKPTVIKFICAALIVIAELVCLIPTIIPSLESEAAHRDDGGAQGIGGILWPLCFAFAIIPSCVSNAVVELSVKNDNDSANSIGTKGTNTDNKERTGQASEINLVYFLFWWSVYGLITVTVLAWFDFLPYFGTSTSFEEFYRRFEFNVLCLFGQSVCSSSVKYIFWAMFVTTFWTLLAISALTRHSEGSSFVAIILSLRTPFVFIFWSLFEEQPFYYHPHTHLSTWLSIGAISVMVPAVVCYDRGDIWYSDYGQRCGITGDNHDQYTEQLVNSKDNSQNT